MFALNYISVACTLNMAFCIACFRDLDLELWDAKRCGPLDTCFFSEAVLTAVLRRSFRRFEAVLIAILRRS